jgi:hypothetical protein
VSSNPIIDNLWKIADKNVQPIRWVTSRLCMPPLINFFSYFIFWIFFRFTFCRALPFAECPFFSDLHFAECFSLTSLPTKYLPSTLCRVLHSAKPLNPVVICASCLSRLGTPFLARITINGLLYSDHLHVCTLALSSCAIITNSFMLVSTSFVNSNPFQLLADRYLIVFDSF